MVAILKKTCLVIPCYNEEARLDIGEYRKFSGAVYFLFVNDGSSDGTLKLLEKEVLGFASVLNLENNSGKAEAVRRGMMHLKTLPFYADIEWAGFWDADLATPLDEVENMLRFADGVCPDADALFGSRICRLGSEIRRNPTRRVISRFFCLIFKSLYRIQTYDSQCGAKIFRKGIVDRAFSEPFISRWIFDVEIILRLKGSRMVEYPVKKWIDVKGSKVMKLGNVVTISRDIFRLWKKYG
ncbi:MAG: glycosyltransferase [Victivallales bacterium]|jgi:glycosyltransferase involved in cell wall biosynthesis